MQLTSNKDLPNTMCSQCLHLLKHAIKFKKSCERSESKILTLHAQSTEDQFINKLVEYSLFIQYYPEDSLSPMMTDDKELIIVEDQPIEDNDVLSNNAFDGQTSNRQSESENNDACDYQTENNTNDESNNDADEYDNYVDEFDVILNKMEEIINADCGIDLSEIESKDVINKKEFLNGDINLIR